MTQSRYTRAINVIRKAYENNNRQPLSPEETQIALEITPGLMFPRGTTLERVLIKLESWKLIQRGKEKNPTTRTIIPLYPS